MKDETWEDRWDKLFSTGIGEDEDDIAKSFIRSEIERVRNEEATKIIDKCKAKMKSCPKLKKLKLQ